MNLNLVLRVRQLASQLLDLAILALLDQLQFVLAGLELPLHLRLVLLPFLHLRLEQLNLILEVVHVDLHLVLEADMAAHITLQLLYELFVLAWRASDEVCITLDARPGRLLRLHHSLDRILHRLLDQIV